VRDFQRRHSLVKLTRGDLLQASPAVVRLALAEGFRGHAQSLLTRFEES
jgi:histidinol dehydrogenase